MKHFLILFLLLSVTAAFSQSERQTADPWSGTFKLDKAKSKISGPAPKEETVTVDAASKDSVKYTIKGTDAQDKSYTVTYDGKVGTASPQTMDGKDVAQITYQMPSSHEFTSESKASDGSSGTARIILSRDGTVREHSKDAKGAAHQQTMVYVRQ